MLFIFAKLFFVCAFVLPLQLRQVTAQEPIDEPSDARVSGFTFMISSGLRDPEKMKLTRFMVSIRSLKPVQFFGDNHFCAGTIVSPTAVLTAAHCVMDKRKVLTRARRMLIVAGTPRRLREVNTTRSYRVAKLTAHPAFLKSTSSDLAVIHIKGVFALDNKTIEIMPLPTGPPPYGKDCTTIGWGRMYLRGPMSDAAMHIEHRLYTLDECRKKVPRLVKILHSGTFCGADESDYSVDPCRGDTGGPLICDGALTGVLAWNIACGTSMLPSFYTDVYHHLDWVRSAMTAAANGRSGNVIVQLVALSCVTITINMLLCSHYGN